MAVDVIGRDEDLRSLYAFLDTRTVMPSPVAIALEGEAGIGKSTLWSAVVDTARERGLRVLSSRPAESERGLAHAGLGDLFDGALDDVLPSLTAPQRRALEVALLVEDAGGRPIDTRALGVAVRNALQLLAADGLVVAIDDLQWLDASSASALGFALRRVPDTSMLLLWTRRLDAGEQASPVETALDPDRIERVRVGPLSIGATHQLLRTRLSRTVPRPTLLRLHEASGGNPFYALELARAALGADGSLADPTQPLPVPERLEELVSTRIDGFTGATREALVLASAHGRLTVTELERAGIEQRALEPALAEQVVEVERGSVRFTHPLLASVLYQGLPAAERQRAHGALAGLVDDPVASARHLALSTDLPEAELAAVLEQAAAAAAAQGAPIAAAELGEHAIRLTPAGDRVALGRRIAAATLAHAATGGMERARTLSEELLALAAPGRERAEALALAAEVEGDYIGRAIELQREALAEPGAPAALCATLHQKLALSVRFREGMEPAEEHARAAVELAEEVGDDRLRAAALAGLALVRLNAGKAGSLRLAEQAAELAALSGDEPRGETDFTVSHVLLWSGEVERARRLLEDRYTHWLERDERSAAYALWYLAVAELRLGRLELADAYAAESRELAAPYTRPGEESPTSLFPSTLIAAHRGDLARARRLAEEMVRLAELHDTKLCGPAAALGTVALWSGEAEAALDWFSKAEQITDPADGAEPTMSWWRAEQAEALLELGLVDDAEARIDAWEEAARRLDRAWPLAEAVRCRGLVAAARGDVDEAIALLEQAVEVSSGFGRGRALLALGVARRRARQKRPAREAIEAACATFEEIGAAGWADRARDELGRIGGRTRVEGLTPAERRVADLVAAGRTNAEVAASLFLAERTVASHLTRVYSKLGVRSRTELSRKLG
jgi:DNA-binding CsgD family transcriptional regulator